MDILTLLWTVLTFVLGLVWSLVWFVLRDLISNGPVGSYRCMACAERALPQFHGWR